MAYVCLPFRGETLIEVLKAIWVKDEGGLTIRYAKASGHFYAIIEFRLQINPDDRFHSAQDLLSDLYWLIL